MHICGADPQGFAITTVVVWWCDWPLKSRWPPSRTFDWARNEEWLPWAVIHMSHDVSRKQGHTVRHTMSPCSLWSVSMHDCSTLSRLLRWAFHSACLPQSQSLLLPYLLFTGWVGGEPSVAALKGGAASELVAWKQIYSSKYKGRYVSAR